MRARATLGAAALLAWALTGCAEPSPVVGPTPPPFPAVAGRVLSTTQPTRGDWVIVVRTEHLPTAYGEARRLLTDAGYQLTQDNDDSPTGGAGQACRTGLCVTFTVTDDPELGPTVQYEVFPTRGVSSL